MQPSTICNLWWTQCACRKQAWLWSQGDLCRARQDFYRPSNKSGVDDILTCTRRSPPSTRRSILKSRQEYEIDVDDDSVSLITVIIMHIVMSPFHIHLFIFCCIDADVIPSRNSSVFHTLQITIIYYLCLWHTVAVLTSGVCWPYDFRVCYSKKLRVIVWIISSFIEKCQYGPIQMPLLAWQLLTAVQGKCQEYWNFKSVWRQSSSGILMLLEFVVSQSYTALSLSVYINAEWPLILKTWKCHWGIDWKTGKCHGGVRGNLLRENCPLLTSCLWLVECGSLCIACFKDFAAD